MFQEIDTAIFYFINNSMHIRAIDPVMVFITKWPPLIFLITLLLIIPKYRSRIILPFVLSLVAFGLSDLTGNYFKHFFERERPFLVLEHVNQLVSAGSFSFPSNHAANSFAFASGMAFFFRRAAVPFLLIAAIVAFSRVYVGVHYPSDILAGSMLGIVVFFMLFGIYRFVNKTQ